jgi:ATP-binding cassette subfamily C protein
MKLQFLAVSIMLLTAVINVVFALYLKVFIDGLVGNQGIQQSFLYGFLTLALLNAGMVIGGFIVDYTLEVLKKKAQVNLWNKMYCRLIESPQNLYDKNPPGEYMSKTLSDTGFVGSIVGAYLPAIIVNIIQFSSNIFAVAVLSPLLTLVILSATPLYFVLYSKQAKHMVSSTSEEREAYSKLIESLRTKVEAVRTIKNLNIGKNVAKLFKLDSFLWYEKIKRVLLVEKRYAFSFNFLRNILPLAVLSIGVYLTVAGLVSIGALVAFFYFSLSFFNPLTVLSTDLGSLAQAVSPIQRVESVLNLPPEKFGEKTINTVNSISFQNVSFSYNKLQALNKITFRVKKGEKVAIIGESGCGKTSLLSLMNGIYAPTEGQVYLNDEPISKYDIGSIRSRIIMLSSKDIIFQGTVLENITLWDNYPKDDIKRAVDIAEVTKDFASLDVLIGPGKKDVSDGQRQRICLGRAVIKKPDVLLLDEALSGVDSRLEGKIIANLRNAFPERTIIAVSHRLSTILSMDKIFLMKKGQIVAEGRFEDLKRSSSEFMSLIKKQIIE